MQRMGQVIRVRPERADDYIRYHAAVWPKVLEKITECNIRNYSIFIKQPEHLLFAYFEYHGTDYEADMEKMAADPITQEWWAQNKPCHDPLETRKAGEWWASMDEIFHAD